MKNSVWYSKLWQTKMQELPLHGDEDAAWEKKMQGLLDNYIPAAIPLVKPKPGTSTGIKLIYILAAIISVAILYYAGNKMLKNHHKQPNKPAGKHARMNTNTITDKNYAGTSNSKPNKAGNAEKNSNISIVKQNPANSSGSQLQSSAVNTFSKNEANIKGKNNTLLNTRLSTSNKPLNAKSSSTNNLLNTKKSTTNNQLTDNSSGRKNNMVSDLNITRNNRTSILSGINLHKKASYNNHINPRHLQASMHGKTPSKNVPQLFSATNHGTTNKLQSSNAGNTANEVAQQETPKPDTTDLSKKINNIPVAKNIDTKQAIVNNAKNQAKKSVFKTKASSPKKMTGSKFCLDIALGANTNKGANLDPFLGITGSYNLSDRWAVSIGTNAPSTRIISGSYSKNNLNYTTVGDSSKKSLIIVAN